MTELEEKIQTALDENRTLTLGAQVFVGFGFRAVFEPGFDKLDRMAQSTRMISLALLLLTMALLLSPSANHRIAERGQASDAFLRLTSRFACLALLPLSLALGLDLSVAVSRIVRPSTSILIGAGGTLLAVTLWYAIEWVARARRGDRRRKSPVIPPTEVKDKVRQVMTECRVILPGAQALLGFQLIATLSGTFDQLPSRDKLMHLGSLAMVAMTTILLIAPAAWHRIVEGGEHSGRFYRLASAMVVAALFTLSLGVSGDFYVVVRKVAHSSAIGMAASCAMLSLFWVLWFGISLVRRAMITDHPRRGVQ